MHDVEDRSIPVDIYLVFPIWHYGKKANDDEYFCQPSLDHYCYHEACVVLLTFLHLEDSLHTDGGEDFVGYCLVEQKNDLCTFWEDD